MLVSIAGVPGTGKTTVAKELAKILNGKAKSRTSMYRLVDLNRLAAEKKAYAGFDEKRKSKIVDTKKLGKYISKLRKSNSNILIEGVFAHLFDSDLLVVLRCKPTVLQKRLERKYKWPTKIRENVEAEMIGLVTDEALPAHKPGTVLEVDTTGKSAVQAAKLIYRLINDEAERAKYYAGKIDWLVGMN